MAYPHYTPPAGAHPPTSTTYPYGAYHPTAYSPHPQTPGAYSYTPSAYQTGVTSYGWPYPYAWPPTQPAHAPTSTTTPVSTTASTHPAVTPTVAQTQPKPTTFTSYTPPYLRESVVAASSGGATGRGSRKQSTRGLFTKEREQPVSSHHSSLYIHVFVVKSIMYGFGDDRNPANDTVNVMEEILVEYIMDVVRSFCTAHYQERNLSILSVRIRRNFFSKNPTIYRRLAKGTLATGRCQKAGPHGRTPIHARRYQACSCTVRR